LLIGLGRVKINQPADKKSTVSAGVPDSSMAHSWIDRYEFCPLGLSVVEMIGFIVTE
jgi:hypothetical protein